MQLKRKRSDSELSFSSSSTFSSPPRPDGISNSFFGPSFDFGGLGAGPMDTDGYFARPPSGSSSFSLSGGTPSHLHSRTLKRFRDNRPSEDMVHQHTLSLLYNAQQRPNTTFPSPMSATMAAPMAAMTTGAAPVAVQPPAPVAPAAEADPKQRSLHSFWRLPPSLSSPSPSLVSVTPSPAVLRSGPPPASCEDCGAGPSGGAGGFDGMDIDGYGFGESSVGGAAACCGGCGKVVCFACSVGNLAQERRCLACAGRKVWIGGIGWTAEAGVVC